MAASAARHASTATKRNVSLPTLLTWPLLPHFGSRCHVTRRVRRGVSLLDVNGGLIVGRVDQFLRLNAGRCALALPLLFDLSRRHVALRFGRGALGIGRLFILRALILGGDCGLLGLISLRIGGLLRLSLLSSRLRLDIGRSDGRLRLGVLHL